MRDINEFIPMAGPIRTVYDALCELVDFECDHQKEHTAQGQEVVCRHVQIVGLEAAANRVANMIELGELT